MPPNVPIVELNLKNRQFAQDDFQIFNGDFEIRHKFEKKSYLKERYVAR